MDHAAAFREQLAARHGLTGVEKIGQGGMGEVYRAFRPQLNDTVAVKRLSGDLANDPAAQARFENEMRTLARIRHPAIVSVKDGAVTDDGEAYYIMDFVPGVDLAQIISDRQRSGRPFTVSETATLLRPIAYALDYLHLRMSPPIVHRDVKPANILVPRDGSYDAESLLTDFGISLAGDATRHTSAHVVAGTVGYLAPELYPAGGDEPPGEPTAASDRYALTLIALEMLTLTRLKETMSATQWQGRDRPFPDLRALGLDQGGPGAYGHLEEVFRKALHTLPGYRYRTAIEFITALSEAQRPRSGDTAPQVGAAAAVSAPGPSRPARRAAGSWGIVAVLGVVALVLAGAVGYLGYLLTSQSPWSPAAKVVAASFPSALPGREGGPGPEGIACQESEAGAEMLAVITCAGEETTYEFTDFGAAAPRDAALDGDNRVGWEAGSCAAESVTREDGSVAVLPDMAGGRFALSISGPDAEQKRLEVPLC